MIPIIFDKTRLVEALDALAHGKAMSPPPGGWRVQDMLLLAGACWFGVYSHGPAQYTAEGLDLKDLPHEHREAVEQDFEANISSAIEFFARVATQVTDDDYDAAFEESVKGLLRRDPNGNPMLIPIEGFKASE